MKNITIIIFLILLADPIFGQDSLESSTTIRSNVFFAEACGSGLLFSMNYKHLFNNKFGVRVGVGSAGLFGLTLQQF